MLANKFNRAESQIAFSANSCLNFRTLSAFILLAFTLAHVNDAVAATQTGTKVAAWRNDTTDDCERKKRPKSTDRYSSELLHTHINTVNTEEIFHFLSRPCGHLLVEEKALHEWRVKTADLSAVLIDGIAYIDLDDIPNTRYDINTATGAIFIHFDPWRFTLTHFNLRPQLRLKTNDSDFAAQILGHVTAAGPDGDSIDSVGGNTRLNLYTPWGRLDSSWGIRDLNDSDKRSFRRSNTTFTTYLDSRAETIEIGDVSASANAARAGYRVGGIAWGRHFAAFPNLIRRPMMHRHFLAETPSNVTISDNSIDRYLEENEEFARTFERLFARDSIVIPPGPNALSNIVYNGNGTMNFHVEDAYGNKSKYSQNYFLNTGLLRPGLADYRVAAGLLRQGEHLHDYRDFIVTADFGYGVNSAFTIYTSFAANEDEYAAGLNTLSSIPYLGVLTTRAAHGFSKENSQGQDVRGGIYGVSLFNQYDGINYGFSTQFSDKRFTTPYRNGSNIDVRWENQVGLGLSFGDASSISFVYSDSSFREADYAQSYELKYRTRFDAGISFDAGIIRSFHPEQSNTYQASVSGSFAALWRLIDPAANPGSSLSEYWLLNPQKTQFRIAASQRDDGDHTATANITTRASAGVHRYTLGASRVITSHNNPSIFANYSNPYMRLNSGTTLTDDNEIGRHQTTLSSGIFIAPGAFHVSPDQTRAAAIIRLGEHGKYISAQGRTANSDGDLLITQLTPYRRNIIVLNTDELPLNKRLKQKEVVIVPPGIGFADITIEVEEIRQALVKVLVEDINGTRKPLGLSARVYVTPKQQETIGYLGDEPIYADTGDKDLLEFGVDDTGTIYMWDIADDDTVTIEYQDVICEIRPEIPDVDDPDEIPEIGPYICRN